MLRPPAADRGATPRSVRGDGGGPRRDSAGVRKSGLRTSVQGGGGPGGGGGGDSVHGAGARTGRSSKRYSKRAAREGGGHSRPGRRRHVAQCRQARDVGERSIARRRPTSAWRWPTPPKRCACWWRRPGDHVQRWRRAVRGAPARGGGQPQLAGRHRRPAGAVVAARHRVARQHRQLHARRLAGRHQPHGPPAPGDDHRQHAAGHVAGRGADTAIAEAATGARTSGPSTGPTSSAARASSIARPPRSSRRSRCRSSSCT